ncbi:dienelactone hydrolase [Flexistipes sinusarabici DSM 4947]|uniref:Dienelactone hydrolase n=1 Tax=Flexistipes sinusarabici (strain ATCC 49648 / DSM 4947 / MAS 10) TaxID=717231 RepID=F8E986_FLESM|nr:dienelactone hydrolase family protein [Flexistipes sinusarabici]AEI15288.1 dienelactone hydrolase [Flexistipes sinusarabici DSM 4947]
MKRFLVIILIFGFSGMALAEGRSVVYYVNGSEYEGYYISAGEKAPLVLLIHDWDGLTEYEVKRSKMINDLGYSVFAADMYGKGVRPEALSEKRRLTSELYRNREKMRDLLKGAISAAEKAGGNTDRAVAIGYCFGGAVVLELARSGADFDAFVTFHGGLSTPEGQDYSKTKGQILVFHGSADQAVTLNDFVSLVKQLESAGVKHEMTTYSGAPHAFTIFGSDRYREDADRKSWNRFVSFLDETFKN